MKLKIEEIRSNHIDEEVEVDGRVIQMSEVRPQIVSAKFECPACGAVIEVQQVDKKFREPSRCSCGREGKFRLLSKTMMDAQRLVIEDLDTIHRENCKHKIAVFITEDLCSYENQKKMLPGKRIKVKGVLTTKEIEFDGGICVRADWVIESKIIEGLE